MALVCALCDHLQTVERISDPQIISVRNIKDAASTGVVEDIKICQTSFMAFFIMKFN